MPAAALKEVASHSSSANTSSSSADKGIGSVECSLPNVRHNTSSLTCKTLFSRERNVVDSVDRSRIFHVEQHLVGHLYGDAVGQDSSVHDRGSVSGGTSGSSRSEGEDEVGLVGALVVGGGDSVGGIAEEIEVV